MSCPPDSAGLRAYVRLCAGPGWRKRGCLSAVAAAELPPSGPWAAPSGLLWGSQGGHLPVGAIQTFLRLHLCTRVCMCVWVIWPAAQTLGFACADRAALRGRWGRWPPRASWSSSRVTV